MSISDTERSANRRSLARPNAGAVKTLDSSRLLEWSVWLSLLSVLYSEITGSLSVAMIGSYNLSVTDPLLVVAVAAFALSVMRGGLSNKLHTVIIVLFSAIFAINFAIGLTIDAGKALFSLRAYGLFAIFLLVGAVGENAAALSRTFERAIYPISAALCGLVVLRLIFGVDLFIYTREISAVGVNDGGRPLSTFGTMILGVTAVFTLSKMLADQFPPRWAAPALAGMIVAILLTGQGTATIAAATGLTIVTLLQRGRQHHARVVLTVVALFLVGFAAIIWSQVTDASALNAFLPEDVANNLVRRQGNFQTRQQAWQGIFRAFNDADPVKKLIGWPAGTSPFIEIINRSWGHVVWNVSAHSMYVGTLISHGAIGAFLFVSLLVTRLISLMGEYASKAPHFLHSPRLIALLIMIAIFSYSYDLRNEGGLMLAVTLIGAQVFFQARRQRTTI